MGDDSEDFVDYGVNDSRKLPKVEIESRWLRTHPIIGQAVDVRWEGEDQGTGIIQLLSNDVTIRNAIIKTCLVSVSTRPEYGCWLIVQKRHTWNPPLLKGYQWRCYERIAEILQAAPLSEDGREANLIEGGEIGIKKQKQQNNTRNYG